MDREQLLQILEPLADELCDSADPVMLQIGVVLAALVGCADPPMEPDDDIAIASLAKLAFAICEHRTGRHATVMTDLLAQAQRLFDETDQCTLGSGNVGGHLHLVLDDPNLEDSDVRGCLDDARGDGCRTCATLAAGLLELSQPARERLYMQLHHLTVSPFAEEA